MEKTDIKMYLTSIEPGLEQTISSQSSKGIIQKSLIVQIQSTMLLP